MKKTVLRLTENDLHTIIENSVNKIIKEYYKKTGKEGFEMEHDYTSHGNDNVNDRKGAAAMNALGKNGEEMESVAKRDKGHGRYNRYGFDESKQYKTLNNLSENTLNNILKRSINKVLNEAKFDSGNIPYNEYYGTPSCKWSSAEGQCFMHFPYEDFAWYLREEGLIQSEEQYKAIEDYFYSNEENFTINASYSGYEDNIIGGDCEICPDESCLSNAINVISSCKLIDDKSKQYLTNLVKEFFEENAYNADKYEYDTEDYMEDRY